MGEWQQDLFQGPGVFVCADGRTYEGEVRGQRCAALLALTAAVPRLRLQFQRGARHGMGRQTLLPEEHRGAGDRWQVGGVGALYRPVQYEGGWKQGSRCGRGGPPARVRRRR